MSARKDAKARMRAAQRDLESAQRALHADLVPVRAWLRRHRNALIVAGGAVSGLAVAALSPRRWSRVRSVFGGSAATLARSFLMPILTSAILSRQQEQAHPAAPDGRQEANPG